METYKYSFIEHQDMDQVKEVENKKSSSPKIEVHNSLKQEVWN